MRDSLIIYVLAEKLIKPFSKWNLCQNGFIDDKGRVLKEGIGDLDRFLIRLKKMVSEEVLATFITFLGKNKETRLETKYIVEQFERTETIGKVDQKINEILLKNNLTRDEYYNYLLEKLQFDEKILENVGEKDVEREDFLNGGKARGKSLEDIFQMHKKNGWKGSMEDLQKEFEKGKAVEKEHTNDVEVAFSISKDHIFELPTYYSHLEKMEQEAKKELK